MVKLTWNVLGWIYQDGIRSLRETFEAALEGINERMQSAYREIDEYDASVRAGAPPQTEIDENGVVIDDYRDVLIYKTITAEETKSALNKALAIALFHHWERAARGWTKASHGKFITLRNHVLQTGYPIHPKLDDLHLLVNLLKHANAKHGLPLFEQRPDLFREQFTPSRSRIEWYDELYVSDQHVAEFIDVIANSGPVATPPSLSGETG